MTPEDVLRNWPTLTAEQAAELAAAVNRSRQSHPLAKSSTTSATTPTRNPVAGPQHRKEIDE